MNHSLFAIITTIQEPTKSVHQLIHRLREINGKLIVIGDRKGPSAFDLEGVEFLSLKNQLRLDFNITRKLPTGHYARKNVGYLIAAAEHAPCIYETDDDNAPYHGWEMRHETVEAVSVKETHWVNVYRIFSAGRIWPRGFPLDAVIKSFDPPPALTEETVRVRAPIQQGLANNSPDVDAIWRLVLDRPFNFQPGPSVYLPRGAWCPFNSQSTWWFPAAYPLLYLPSYCSFRMTDIWRSYIAQRCIWEADTGLVFHGPEVIQQRNEHDLMRDFKGEIPGYTRNRELVEVLEELTLAKGAEAINSNLLICYEALIKAQFLPDKELDLVTAWLDDLNMATQKSKAVQVDTAVH